MRCPSLSLILSQIFLAYIAYSIYTLSLLFVAPSCEERKSCLTSYIAAKPELRLHVYSSARKHPSDGSVDLIHTNDNFNYTHPSSLELILNVTQKTQQTGKLFLHVFVLPNSKRVSKSFSEIQKDPYVSSTVIKMTQYAVPEAEAFNLLGNKKKDAAVKQENRALPVPHIRTKVTFTVMTDDVQLPVNNVPIELMSHLRIIHGRIFLPIVNYDSLQSRDRDLVRLTPKDNTINITLSYLPISLGKLRLILHIEKAILTLKSLGFSDKDVDEAKGLFTDINIYLLGGTFFIAAVHLLFDFLAFKNDVNFWRKKDNLIGLSKWTVMWRGFSQTVIFLYLLNEGSSVLVLIPAGIGSIIEIWKLKKVLKLRFHKNSNDAAEIRTREVDAEIMRYLSHLLYPLVIGGAIYSLLYQPHKSWYSWSINSLANGVYAFGFLFMLPQLFVNYKLKSVAHLPWRAFTYKAFNTFIDDVFAFIVPMPTAHRLACFRDDAVFLMYLYQRWLYPVDRSRTDIDMATGEVVDFGDSKKKD